MGEGRRGRDQVLHSHVAAETHPSRVCRRAETVDRLRREVLLARRLSHPNVCREVTDLVPTRPRMVRCSASSPTGVPEERRSPTSWHARAGCRRRRCSRCSVSRGAGLTRHRGGVVDRDLKASNVMLVGGGRPDHRNPVTRARHDGFSALRVRCLAIVQSEPATGSGIIGTPSTWLPRSCRAGRVGPRGHLRPGL